MRLQKTLRFSLTVCSGIACALAFCIVFVVCRDVAMPTVSGKSLALHYLLPVLTGLTILLLLCPPRPRIGFGMIDLLIAISACYVVGCYYGLTGGVYDQLVTLGSLLCLYIDFRILFSLNPPLIRILPLVIMATGIVEGIMGLGQLYGFYHSNHALFKMTGSFFNPGPYSNYLALIAPIGLYQIVRLKFIWPGPIRNLGVAAKLFRLDNLLYIAGWALLLLSVIILPAARGRTAWVAVALASTLLLIREAGGGRLLINFYSRRKKMFRTVSVCGIALGLILAVSIYNFKKDSAEGRILIWKVCSQIIREHPGVGVGIGHFGSAYGNAQADYFATGHATEKEIQIAGVPEYAFNDLIQGAVEFGLTGAALFLAIIAFTLYGLIRTGRCLLYGMVSLLILMQASYPLNLLPISTLLVFFMAAGQSGLKPFTTFRSALLPTAFLSGALVWSIASIPREKEKYEALQDWNQLQIIYKSEDYRFVCKDYGELFARLSEEPRFVFEYGRALGKLGHYQLSDYILREGSRLSSDPMSWNIVGNNRKERGDHTGAEACYKKAYNLLPNRLYPLYLLAKLYQETGQSEKARETARKVRAFEPKVSSPATTDMKNEIDRLIPDICPDSIKY